MKVKKSLKIGINYGDKVKDKQECLEKSDNWSKKDNPQDRETYKDGYPYKIIRTQGYKSK